MLKRILITVFCLTAFKANAQYTFSGNIDKELLNHTVYLSLIEDYRKTTSIYTEHIFHKTPTDSTGNFEFCGNEIDPVNRIYRIHVDNCSDNTEHQNHFDGYCKNCKSIVFVAKNTDSIMFPYSFGQMFCNIQSNNPKTNAIVQIDSLREDMKFAYGEFRSETNRKLNDKKWFKTFQEFGKQLNEPLAELYIYAFLSDRTSPHHNYYLEDLKTNPYYDDLLQRLQATYPNSSYTKQYQAELNSDKYIVNGHTKGDDLPWKYLLFAGLMVSLALNFYLIYLWRKRQTNHSNKAKALLTLQEQKVVELVLQDKSNKELADALFVSVSTVKTHINNIYKKLNVQSRDELKQLY